MIDDSLESANLPRKLESKFKATTKIKIEQEGLKKHISGGRTVSVWKSTKVKGRIGKYGYMVRLRGPTGVTFLSISKDALEALNAVVTELEEEFVKISYRVYTKEISNAAE